MTSSELWPRNRPAAVASVNGEGVAVQLEVLTAGLDPAPRVLLKGRRASLGRGVHCDVRIPDPSVSRLHASIVKRGPNYLLIDENSRYGTGIGTDSDPIWLAPDSPRIIEDGEHIWLGQIELKVSLIAAKRDAETGQDELPRTLVRAGLAAVGLEPDDQLVESTLLELTELPDEEVPLPSPDENPSPLAGVADLFDEDRHPPWKTDLFIAAVALLVTIGCLLLYMNMDRLK